MNILYTLLITIGLIVVNPSIHGLTPQASNKMLALEADLNGKYDIVKKLNDASKSSSKDRKAFRTGTYSLTIESIEQLRKEISSNIDQIIAIDNTYGNTKIAARDENFKIMNEWVSNGKIGTEKSITLGGSKEEFTGISQLQHPITQIIDKLRSLTSSDPLYKSEIDLLSASLDVYRKQFAAYDNAIYAQYPKIGFSTEGIFLGLDKINSNNQLVFTDLKKQIDSVASKLETATDSKGTLLINETSKWNEPKTVGERIKDQITKIRTDGTKEMQDAIVKIAKESYPSRDLTPDSPWIYAEKKVFIPFLTMTNDLLEPMELSEDVKGSFASINNNEGFKKSLSDMVLIVDADKAITSYLELDNSILNNSDNKKELQKFASTYARITAEALDYALAVSIKDVNANQHRDLYNRTIITSSAQLKQSFTQFYQKHKQLLSLDDVHVESSEDIRNLAELTTIKSTAVWIKNANPMILQ